MNFFVLHAILFLISWIESQYFIQIEDNCKEPINFYGSGGQRGQWREEAMDEKAYFKDLCRREKELLERIEKMRKTMNETVELNTLGFMSELLEEAKKELSMVQEKLSKLGNIDD